MDNSTAITVQVPVTIFYTALEAAVRKKIMGETLPPPSGGREEEPYARVRDVRVAASPTAGYELLLKLKLDILRTFFKREGVELWVLAGLGYDNEHQLLYVRRYKVDSRTQSRIYNASLEVLANKAGYDQILKRARFNVGDLIAREVRKVNEKLAPGLGIKGLMLKGAVEVLRVDDIAAQPEGIHLSVRLQGQLEAEVLDLLSLMPEQQDPV